MRSVLKKLHYLWAFLFYCVTTGFMTYPLVLHLKTSVIGGMGDNIYNLWLVRWYQKVFLEGQGHPFFNPWLNYPQGWNLSTTETTLASALPGVPVSYFFGPVAGYNFAILLTFVLAGFFMYLWVRDLTKSNWAGLLAGFIYAFSPFQISHFLVGHLNLCSIQWFPLFFWGLHNLLKTDKKFDLRSILMTGLSLGLIAFSSMHYLYMALLFSFIFVVAWCCFTRFKLFGNKFFWLNAASALLLSLPFLVYSLRPYLSLAKVGTLASRSFEYASMYSASPTDFFLPSPDHFLFGAWVNKWFDRSLWNESSLYIGLVTLVFALIALAVQKRSPQRWLIWSAFAVIVSSFLLGLGISLHWNNQEVIWQIPVFLQPVFHQTKTVIYLPASWLFAYLPFFDKMRVIMRFGFFVLLFMPVLAGIGFSHVQDKLKPKFQTIFALGILALALFDFYPGSYAYALSQPRPRPVDLWLAEQPGKGAVVQMPFAESADQSQVYYTLYYQKPFLGGYFSSNYPIQYLELLPMMEQFPDEHSLPLLKQLGVEFIVVDVDEYPDQVFFRQQMDRFGLIKLTELDGQAVYTFSAP